MADIVKVPSTDCGRCGHKKEHHHENTDCDISGCNCDVHV